MPIKSIKGKASITFALPADVNQKLNAWFSAQDAKVFHTQVITGRFQGKQKLRASDWLRLKEMHKAGRIKPYYGAIGGANSYHLTITPDITTVHVYNEFTDEFLDVRDRSDIEIQTRTRSSRQSRSLKPTSSPALTPQGGKLFTISGREYANLLDWSIWKVSICFTDRYIYSFGSTSIGTVIRVVDLTSAHTIDLTDYNDW